MSMMNLPAITALVEATAGMILLTTPEDVTHTSCYQSAQFSKINWRTCHSKSTRPWITNETIIQNPCKTLSRIVTNNTCAIALTQTLKAQNSEACSSLGLNHTFSLYVDYMCVVLFQPYKKIWKYFAKQTLLDLYISLEIPVSKFVTRHIKTVLISNIFSAYYLWTDLSLRRPTKFQYYIHQELHQHWASSPCVSL